jgi:hypothetical protein
MPSWLYGSWIYNYLCNQYLSPLKLWVRIPLMANTKKMYIYSWFLFVLLNFIICSVKYCWPGGWVEGTRVWFLFSKFILASKIRQIFWLLLLLEIWTATSSLKIPTYPLCSCQSIRSPQDFLFNVLNIIVCPFAIVLSVLQFMASDYPVCIFKLGMTWGVLWLLQTKHLWLWHNRYSAKINQVMVVTVKLSKWWPQLNHQER